jgi:hypothetical protein
LEFKWVVDHWIYHSIVVIKLLKDYWSAELIEDVVKIDETGWVLSSTIKPIDLFIVKLSSFILLNLLNIRGEVYFSESTI